MKIKTILLTLIILTAVFVAGCIELQEQELPKVETPDIEPIDEVEIEPIIEPECSIDKDCDDDDYCTTESCVKGGCTNTLITGCRQKESSEPTITEVQLGEKEWIRITANNYRVDEWTLENQNGTVFYTFLDYTTLNNYLLINTERGIATDMEWYLFRDDFWNVGDTVILKNADGEIISEMQG